MHKAFRETNVGTYPVVEAHKQNETTLREKAYNDEQQPGQKGFSSSLRSRKANKVGRKMN